MLYREPPDIRKLSESDHAAAIFPPNLEDLLRVDLKSRSEVTLGDDEAKGGEVGVRVESVCWLWNTVSYSE